MEGFPAGEPGAAYFAEFLHKAARWAPLLRQGGTSGHVTTTPQH
jgi:hypothetical protein